MIIDEKTINKNIQDALSVIADNVDKDSNLIDGTRLNSEFVSFLKEGD